MRRRRDDVAAAWSRALEMIGDGVAVVTACKRAGISRSAFYARMRPDSETFKPDCVREYIAALADSGEVRGDEVITLSDEEPPPDLEGASLSAWVQRQRMRVDARKWVAARLAPKRYGDHVNVEVLTKNFVEVDIRNLLEERDRQLKALDFIEGEIITPKVLLPTNQKEHQK